MENKPQNVVDYRVI